MGQWRFAITVLYHSTVSAIELVSENKLAKKAKLRHAWAKGILIMIGGTSMNSTPQPSLEKPSHKRPWYELHLSTVFVVLLLAGFITIIEIHGNLIKEERGKTEEKTYRHGSPWIYLEREVTDCHALDAWEFHSDPLKRKFSSRYLLLDLLLAMTVLILAGSLVEHCRRKSGFTLIGLLLLTLLSACVIWWCVTHYNQRIENTSQFQGRMYEQTGSLSN